jgi:cupin 2 domain-containing protein
MAEAQLQQFLNKIQQLNAFVALSEAQPVLREALRNCDSHHDVVCLAAQFGFDIGRRWGDTTAATNAKAAQHDNQSNLFNSPCPADGSEAIEVLAQGRQWRLERIHSCNAASDWYDQVEQEWVLLLRGSARLQFADEREHRDLCVGDLLYIAPHRRHRVVSTDPAPGTLWLALFASVDD